MLIQSCFGWCFYFYFWVLILPNTTARWTTPVHMVRSLPALVVAGVCVKFQKLTGRARWFLCFCPPFQTRGRSNSAMPNIAGCGLISTEWRRPLRRPGRCRVSMSGLKQFRVFQHIILSNLLTGGVACWMAVGSGRLEEWFGERTI